MDNDKPNPNRRRFLTTAATAMGGVGVVAAAVPFIGTLAPSARTRLSGGPVEVDISQLQPNEMMVVEWRGKPIWILRRSQKIVDNLVNINDDLRDPESRGDSDKKQIPEYAHNIHRSKNPEYLVLIGICTHLGCSPEYVRPDEPHNYGDNWLGGFVCACHFSRFDLAGRVYKGVPAPENLKVPKYRFLDKNNILIGDDSGAA